MQIYSDFDSIALVTFICIRFCLSLLKRLGMDIKIILSGEKGSTTNTKQ